MTERRLLIAGATGLVGAAAVVIALQRGWLVLALARAGRAPPTHPGLETLVCDFGALDEARAAVAAFAPTACLCALGTTIRIARSQDAFARVDRDYVSAFAGLGAACGAKRFGLVSSVGAQADARNFYLRIKGEAEAAVRGAGFDLVEIARPSFLLGARRERRSGEGYTTAMARALSPLMQGPASIYRPISAEIVAGALVRALETANTGQFVRHYRDLVALAEHGEARGRD